MNSRPDLRCACGGAHLKEAFSYRRPPEGETCFDLRGQVYQRGYDRCDMCGHFFSRHNMDLSGLYAFDYVDATYGGVEGMKSRLDDILSLDPSHSDNIHRVAYVLSCAASRFGDDWAGRRLLDVGAGIGVFPAEMKKAGWSVTGIEPDPRTATFLRDVVGIEAISEDIFNLTPERIGLFDVISFNKVLEHVADPVPFLSKGSEFLAPGGFMYVELPDVAAANEGPGREEFFIEHHHVFSLQSFAYLCDRAGLEVQKLERLREPSGKYTLRGVMMGRAVMEEDLA